MKIVSYNVNGMRAALKKGFLDWLQAVDPDVVCLQEIKAMQEQLDLSIFKQAGYAYNYWFSAQKKGYSGVAILSKTKPDHIEFGTGIEYMDFEGRNIRADFGDLSVMSLYLPSGTNIARLEHKLTYMADFQVYTNQACAKHIRTLLFWATITFAIGLLTYTTLWVLRILLAFFRSNANGLVIL